MPGGKSDGWGRFRRMKLLIGRMLALPRRIFATAATATCSAPAEWRGRLLVGGLDRAEPPGQGGDETAQRMLWAGRKSLEDDCV